MAVYLGRSGFEVDVYEKRLDLRRADIGGGRSINLALSARGIHALSKVGLADDVMRQVIPMPGRMIHASDGGLSYQPYGRDGEAINSVSRRGLNALLLDAAEKQPNVRFHFRMKCVDLNHESGEIEFEHATTAARSIIRGGPIIGADGAFSAVRARLQRLERFSHSLEYLDHGYKELTIPPAASGGFRMEKHALHIWPRRSFMMIALPNSDGSYTVTCFFPMEGANSFAELSTESDVRAFFGKHFPDALPLMPDLPHDFFTNPTGTLATVRCQPWRHQDKVVLLGDAAHAIVPFFGQGMNAAFEDCTALHDCLVGCGARWGEAFAKFEALRKEHCDAIADLALANFIEMRDHTGSPAFLRKKKREKLLHRLFPRHYVPLYSMVSFTCIPYADAVRRAAAQERLVRRCKWIASMILVLVTGLLAWLVLG